MPSTPQYPGHVTMTHRDHEEPWDCPVSYVGRAKEQGWKPVDDSAPGLFDPSTKSVEQVNAHLATITDENERERILAAERSGKNRTTITGD